jgi:hypothetical protein
VRRRLAIAAGVGLVAFAALYWFVVRVDTVEPRVQVPKLAAAIGEGDEAVGVTGDGDVVRWLPLPEDPPLPQLPLDGPPKKGRVGGPALEQVQVLAAAPEALRPYLASSSYGKGGVGVELTTGIELQFGDAGRAPLKWRAVAGVLADSSITALDYVNVSSPRRPSYEGSSYELPPAP